MLSNASHVASSRHRRRLADPPTVHGPPHSFETAYYVGCGWSFWFTLDLPCRDGALDDQIFMVNRTFVLPESVPQPATLPTCRLNETDLSNGRWVRMPWPNTTVCPEMQRDDSLTKFPAFIHHGDKPYCYHREDLRVQRTKCVEMNCRFIPQESLWQSNVGQEHNFYGVYRNYDCNMLEFTSEQLQQCITKRKLRNWEVKGASISNNLKVSVMCSSGRCW